MEVIDCHCHIYPDKIAQKAADAVGKFYSAPMHAKDGATSSLLEAAEGTPINRFIVYSVATRPDQVRNINDFIASECAKHPEFVGFMTLHQDFEDPEAEIERATAMGLSGIKLHPDTQEVNLDDPRLMRIYEIAEGRLPMVIHTGDYRYDFSHPRRMKRVLHKFPNLVVDAAHFGGWSLFDLGFELLEDENCYVDVSSAFEFLGPKRSAELIEGYGPDRVMFGSDFPMWEPAKELAFLESLGLSEEDLEKVMHKTAERFLSNKLPNSR